MTDQQAITAIRERIWPDPIKCRPYSSAQKMYDLRDLMDYIDEQQAEIVRLRAAYEAANRVNLAYIGIDASDDCELRQAYYTQFWQAVKEQRAVFEELETLAAGDGEEQQ